MEVLKLIKTPNPLRGLAKLFLNKFRLGDYETRLNIGAVKRPHYGYCVYHGANIAKKLGFEEMSVLEFGVADGKGLTNLEAHAKEVEDIFSIDISIFGFDTGQGLPEPVDYRDLPYHWEKGEFNMKIEKLKSKLDFAELVLDDIENSKNYFFEEYDPPL